MTLTLKENNEISKHIFGISVSKSEAIILNTWTGYNWLWNDNARQLTAFLHPFIPLVCAECDDSLPLSGTSSIPLCYITFPSTLFHQLVFHPPSLHFAIYFLVYPSTFLFPNSYIILLGRGILFSSTLCTCPNQHNLFNLIVSITVGFLIIA